jgi:hypothetical protein
VAPLGARTGAELGVQQHELWEPDDEPCGPAARAWEPPEIRAARYEKALRGILACASPEPTVWLLQSVAASALGYDALADDLLRRVMARSNAPEGAP